MQSLKHSTFSSQLSVHWYNDPSQLDSQSYAAKKGDLYGVKVYKFNMINQLTLLTYNYDTHSNVITLLALGTHEGFYKDLKLSI